MALAHTCHGLLKDPSRTARGRSGQEEILSGKCSLVRRGLAGCRTQVAAWRTLRRSWERTNSSQDLEQGHTFTFIAYFIFYILHSTCHRHPVKRNGKKTCKRAALLVINDE